MRQLRLCVLLFGGLALVLVPVLFSLNLLQGHDSANGLDKLSWASVNSSHPSYYWADLCLVLCVVVGTVFMIYQELNHSVAVRQMYLQIPGRKHFVLVWDVATGLLTEHWLRKTFEYRSGSLQEIWIDGAFSELSRYNDLYKKIVTLLEAAESNFIKKSSVRAHRAVNAREPPIGALENIQIARSQPFSLQCLSRIFSFLYWLPARPSRSESYIRRLAKIEYAVNVLLQEPPNLRSTTILRFADRAGAYVASQMAVSPSRLCHMAVLLESSWQTILFENLSVTRWYRGIRNSLTTVVSTMLIAGWTIPIALAGSLSQLADLPKYFVWASWLMRVPTWVLSLAQGTLPQLICALLMMTFPYLLRFVMRQRKLPTMCSVELALQRYYFAFLFLHLFFTVSVSSGLTGSIGRAVWLAIPCTV
jgi:calcium permeable stress-gated cation channel